MKVATFLLISQLIILYYCLQLLNVTKARESLNNSSNIAFISAATARTTIITTYKHNVATLLIVAGIPNYKDVT